jgi:hypothetical protein
VVIGVVLVFVPLAIAMFATRFIVVIVVVMPNITIL